MEQWPYVEFLDGQGAAGLASLWAMWLALSPNLVEMQPTPGKYWPT